MLAFENENSRLALDTWHQAEHKDPSFPLVHIFISQVTTDPQEQRTERHRAQALAARGTKSERLLIKWLAALQEEQYVPAIAAMNDLVNSYPADKRVAFLAGRWLSTQEQYEPAARLLERATTLDATYAAAWNQLAYCHAHTGDFSKAFSAMERYASLMPKDPNPQASYAEILRMAGNFRDALAHYRQALQIDPAFQSAQAGIADTYALMGEESTARTEYDKAIRQAASDRDKIRFALRSAITYVREKKHARAIAALGSVANQAREAHLPLLESEAFHDMALIERDNLQSLRYVNKAMSALSAATNASAPDLHQERAEVLRIRAVRTAATGDANGAAQVLTELEQLVNGTRGDSLRRAYSGAMGGVLIISHKYAEAIPYLEEDTGNPLSLRDLIVAYTQVDSTDRAHVVELKLAALNQPTVEQALVVPELRARLAATKDKRGWLRRLTGLSQ